MKIYRISKSIRLHRGESSYNKGGKYWTPSKEWARQFTQSGQDREIKSMMVPEEWIYVQEPLPYATNADELDLAEAKARELGFRAIKINEGEGEPYSVLFL